MEPSFLKLYEALIDMVNSLGVEAYSASQEVENAQMPIARIQLLNGNSTGQYHTARVYSYPFQIDVVTEQNKLAQGLSLAYQVMEGCRTLSVEGYQAYLESDPSLSSMVDSSTNRILNRQIIRVSYDVVEGTAY